LQGEWVTGFQRHEHRIIAELLRSMNHALIEACKCFFGGGTAIVLTHGEYRRSLDIDFLCSDREGYRALRSLVTTSKVMPSILGILSASTGDFRQAPLKRLRPPTGMILLAS
jgi:Nucleotidyl transferase AbiEii toxin, Type IV TA system